MLRAGVKRLQALNEAISFQAHRAKEVRGPERGRERRLFHLTTSTKQIRHAGGLHFKKMFAKVHKFKKKKSLQRKMFHTLPSRKIMVRLLEESV